MQIKDGILYINNEAAYVSPTSATFYTVTTNNVVWDEETLQEAGIRLNRQDNDQDFMPVANSTYHINLSLAELELVKKLSGFKSAKRDI